MNELAAKYNPADVEENGIATGWKTDYSNLSPTVENLIRSLYLRPTSPECCTWDTC